MAAPASSSAAPVEIPSRCVFPACPNFAARSADGPQMYLCYSCLAEYMTWRAGHGNPVYDGESLADLYPHEQFVTYVHTTKSASLPPKEADPYFDTLKCATEGCSTKVQRPHTMCAKCLQVYIQDQQYGQGCEITGPLPPRNPYGVPLNQAEPTPLPEVQAHPNVKESPPPAPEPDVQRMAVPQTVTLQRFGVANKCRGCDTLILNDRTYCVDCSQALGHPIWRPRDLADVPLYAPHVPASEVIQPKHAQPTADALARDAVGGGNSEEDKALISTLKEIAASGQKLIGQLKAKKAAAAAAKKEKAESA